MNEMMSYVFNSLQKNEVAIAGIAKVLKSQAKLNNKFVIFMVGTAVCLYASERRCKKLEKKVKELSAELDTVIKKEVEEGDETEDFLK